jgi:bifunctional non-homologous end joining protein LigD
MPSWSVPKGPTLDSSVRRLAMPTGDHRLDYAGFEGVIPKGEYGAGPVMIWDRGTYNVELEVERGVRQELKTKALCETEAKRELEEGNLKFRLYGKKLAGSFALVRTRGFAGKESWLLIKHRDTNTVEGYDPNDYDFSEATGRSMDEIAASGR